MPQFLTIVALQLANVLLWLLIMATTIIAIARMMFVATMVVMSLVANAVVISIAIFIEFIVMITAMTIMMVAVGLGCIVIVPRWRRIMMLLVRELSVSLVAAKLPLAVFFLPDIVVQSDGLVKQ